MFEAPRPGEFVSPDPRIGGQARVPGERTHADCGALGVMSGKHTLIEIGTECRATDQQRAARKQDAGNKLARAIDG
jgi:hypothetical protein